MLRTMSSLSIRFARSTRLMTPPMPLPRAPVLTFRPRSPVTDLSTPSLATFFAVSRSGTPPSEPGTTGMPRDFAVSFAVILSPMTRICSADGPMKVIP